MDISDITIQLMQEACDRHSAKALKHKWQAGRDMVLMKRQKNLLPKLKYGIKAFYHDQMRTYQLMASVLEPVRIYSIGRVL